MKYQLPLERISNGMHAVSVDAHSVQQWVDQGIKRVVCSIGNARMHVALNPRKQGGCWIYINTATVKSEGLRVGASVAFSLELDNTPLQFDVPEEFAEVLETDPEAKSIFSALTPGNQRGLIYLVTQVKSIDKRIARALHIAEQLKHGIHSPKVILK